MLRRQPPARRAAALALLTAAALAALPSGWAACDASLTLPPGGGIGLWDDEVGWCSPYAADGATDDEDTVHAVCRGIAAVPPGGVLSFGTCALPGAACTGSTALALRHDVGDHAAAATSSPLLSLGHVELNNSAARLSQGCVLGASCSYGEWRNPGLTAAALEVEEFCYGHSACAGVVGWHVHPDAALAAAAAPHNATALAFTLTPLRGDVTVTRLGGSAPAGASVDVWGAAVAASASPGNATGWALLWRGTWAAGVAVQLSTPLVLTAGVSGALLVASSSAAAPLACAHALGASTDELLADDALSVSQGGALAAAFTPAADAAACAWDGLSLTYTLLDDDCAPPGPPPSPSIATSAPSTLVNSLDDLLRALAEPAVRVIEVNEHIALNGSALNVRLRSDGTRTLVIEGTNACHRNDPTVRLCSISAGGASRVFAQVQEGVHLWVGHLELRDGLAPDGEDGGCMLAACANCSLVLEAAELRNCSAPHGRGGGLAARGGGALTASDLVLDRNVAGVGGGMLVAGSSSLSLLRGVFTDNTATSTAQHEGLGGLRGPAGGAVALFDVAGNVTACAFSGNVATTSDQVLLANPGVPQARGGGLFAAWSMLDVHSCTFSGNVAAFGGGLYADECHLSVEACAFVDGVANIGDGGALFASDAEVHLSDTLVSGNAAGGRMGGALSFFNASVTVERCVLTDNSAPDGCGGALGLEAGAVLALAHGTVVHHNEARSGGGLCCHRCTEMNVADAFLYENIATTGLGGALHSAHSPVALLNVSLWANSAPAGGALSAESSPLNVTDCVLRGNAALVTHGGAVLHDSADDAQQGLTITRTVMDGNTCMAAGGAVAAFWSVFAVIAGCTFSNNSITSYSPAGGGLMALNVASLSVLNSTFAYNAVTKTAELPENAPLGYITAVDAPGAGTGGALWVGADATSATASILGSNFSHNEAPSAGALHATGSLQLHVRWSTFEHDHAYGDSSTGGALLTDLETVSLVEDTFFASCEAVRGGGCWHGAESVTTYARCVWAENEGSVGDDTKGSALFIAEAAHVSVTDGCEFLHNKGHGLSGGTVALAGSNASRLHVADALFDENYARLGGCLHIVRACVRAT
jgi:predicted outer membrane repeat protein